MTLRCYLSVVLCLISSDFAECSLALYKHVVSDVTKNLKNFTSLALCTLTPMSFIFFADFVTERILFLRAPRSQNPGCLLAQFLLTQLEKVLGYHLAEKITRLHSLLSQREKSEIFKSQLVNSPSTSEYCFRALNYKIEV